MATYTKRYAMWYTLTFEAENREEALKMIANGDAWDNGTDEEDGVWADEEELKEDQQDV